MPKFEPDYNGMDLEDSLRMLESIWREANAINVPYPPFIDPEIERIRNEIQRQSTNAQNFRS